MSDRWINVETLKKVSGWSERTIDRKSRSQGGRPREIDWRPMKSNGRGRPPREFNVLSLPSDIQEKLDTATDSNAPFPGREPAKGGAPVSLQLRGRLPRDPAKRDDEGLDREGYWIREFVRFCTHPDNQKPAPIMLDGHVICSHVQMANYVAQKIGKHVSAIFRKAKKFTEDGGLDGLRRKTREDAGKSRFFEDYPKAAAHAAYVHLEQRQSARCAYEAIVRDHVQLDIPREYLPDYQTVRRWLKSIPPVYVALAREGRRSYRERMAPYISRAYAEKPNEIWVSDHMIHDVEAQNDCFNDAPAGAPIRLRFTCLLDFRSRYVVGASWCWEGSSDSIASALLAEAVGKYGPARMLCIATTARTISRWPRAPCLGLCEMRFEPTDWYAHEFERIDGNLGVLARLGMTVQHCIVRHPQSKHVERFFRTVHERFDKTFPTYTGGSPATRPDFTADAMAHHRRLLRIGQPQRSRHPLASEVIRMCRAWIEEYHQRTQTGKGMDGRSPAQVFEEREVRPVPDQQVLALLLLERQRRRVRECAVTLNRGRYIGCDETGRAILHELNECDVLVAYDPLDTSEAAILNLNGDLLTFTKAEIFLPLKSPTAHEAIAQSMAERRRLEKQTASTILAIGDEARANGAVTEVEHLARKAQLLPMAVGDHITQRRVRIRPDDTATAPASPGEIARMLIAMEDE